MPIRSELLQQLQRLRVCRVGFVVGTQLIGNSEFRQMNAHISSLQEQVNTLFSNLDALRSHIDTNIVPMDASPYMQPPYGRSMSISQASGHAPSPSYSRTKSITKNPQFRGPTSSAFNFGVAKSSLQTMGITGEEEVTEEGLITQDGTPAASPPLPSAVLPKPGLHETKDPIWALDKEEAIRLCHVWEDEMGLMYPVLDIDRIIQHATLLYTFMEAANRTGLMQPGLPGADSIQDVQTSILKLILASSMLMEGSGKSALGQKMFERLHTAVEAQLLVPVNIEGIQMLILTVS